MSVGYATLYGDMCGGYSVLKDVYKTTVFALSRWRNEDLPIGGRGPAGGVIPERIMTKPPTAELTPNQTDQDSLPPYDDAGRDPGMPGRGRDDGRARSWPRAMTEATVRRIWRMLDLAEYKRRQAPPGVKITRRAFGRDRRYPITNAFRAAKHGRSRPLRAEPDGPAACRQYLHRARQLAVRQARRAAGSCCASTTPIASARPRPSPRASRRICAGWASTWDELARQSDRLASYDAAAERLKASGPALCLLRDAGGAGPQAQAAAPARRAAGL